MKAVLFRAGCHIHIQLCRGKLQSLRYFAQYDEWNSQVGLQWFLIDDNENNRKMQQYFKALQHFYTSHPAFYEQDFDPSGFEWMSCDDYQSSVVSLVRKTKNGKWYLTESVLRLIMISGTGKSGFFLRFVFIDFRVISAVIAIAIIRLKILIITLIQEGIVFQVIPVGVAFEYNHTMPKPEGATKKKTVKKEEVKKPVAKKIAKAAKKTTKPEAEAPVKEEAPAKAEEKKD